MDSGLTTRPIRGIARTGGTVRPSIATDLAPSQTVTAVPNPATARNNTGRDAPVESSDVAKVVRDAQSREVLYRTLDERSWPVMRQPPEIVASRLKAYTRPKKENPNPDDPQADFEV